MGPNGCGKSTFSKVLAGNSSYKIENGEITFLEKNLLDLSPEVRAHEGLFLAFQAPPEISGVTTYEFLRLACNERRKYFNQQEYTPIEFFDVLEKAFQKLKFKFPKDFLDRNFNEGFSGGEKKRNEILQLILLEPKLTILDEIDSGLDIDALKGICLTLKENFQKNSSLLVITHNPKILEYLEPDFIHVMIEGKIRKTGSKELVTLVEKQGYEFEKAEIPVS
jgi:Fe-S cluster assembly ATP-binding protein